MKNYHRLLSLCMTLVLSASVLAVTVMADPSVGLYQDLFKNRNAHFNDPDQRVATYDSHKYKAGEKLTLNAEDYEKYIYWGEDTYERLGLGITSGHEKITQGKNKLDIPPFPEKGTKEEQQAWMDTYQDITLAYGYHEHDLRNARWFYDNNYHWKNCPQCGRRAFLRWHSDHDKDGVCDLCGNAIHYYNITVKDSVGGKVTVSAPKGEMNDRIDVTVTPDAGYHLGEVRFYNNNEKHSQLTRWEDKAGAEYHFVILNWDIEIEADFVKD